MLKRGVICHARPRRDLIVSSIFCVTKKGTDKLRPCLDLRPLNRFLDPPKFWLNGLLVVRKLLRPGDWTCSLNLSSAYWHVPLARKVKRYFHFSWKGVEYRFDVLPFGVSVVPWVFWKILLLWAENLRSQGVRVVVYLDDILIMADSFEQRYYAVVSVSVITS